MPSTVPAGFTLIEILVVLAIIAAISSIVGPAAWRALQSAERRGAEADLQAALAALPMAAFAQGRPLTLDAAGLTQRLPALPDGCQLNLPAPLKYGANGTSAGARVELACGDTVTAFEVLAVTGEVRRVEGATP